MALRILVLSHYFPPEVNAPASRMYEHCRQWVQDGHDVTVVTGVPNHPRGKVYPGYRNKLFQREERDGIHVVRVWTYVTANEGFLKRSCNYVFYMVAATAAAALLPRAEVVVSTSPQFFNGLAGYLVGAMKRAPWVLEIRDLWPESIRVVGAVRSAWMIRALERLEMFAYRNADAIVPVTDAFKRYMVAKGIAPGKIEVITNGVDLDFFAETRDVVPDGDEIQLQGKFVCSYFGTLGMAHHLETVLEAASILRRRADIVFLLVGDGAEREKLKAMRDHSALENVIMLSQQPKERMPLLWQRSDASMVLLKRSDLFKMVIPSKIFESMAMQRPIILGVEGESRQIVEQARAGVCIEPENAVELARRVVELADNRHLCQQLGCNGRQYVTEHYDRAVLARRYEDLMSRVAARRACGAIAAGNS